MSEKTFQAMLVEEGEDKKFQRNIVERSTADLPEGDVLVKVQYSSLNYKDALSASGNKGVTRKYPHTPGIDAAGTVEESADGRFKPGDRVIVTSYDLGMNTSGGFGGYIRVPAGWVVPMPDGLTERTSMIYGTAGFTAALSIYQLVEHDVTPDKGPVLVSGATGGVGGISVSILSKLGFSVAAVTTKEDKADYLKEIGASSVVGAGELVKDVKKPLLRAVYAGCVDTVGGDVLAAAIKSTLPAGVVSCCGNAASPDLPLNVFPFILRGVILAGIDSQNCPMPLRQKAWEKLAGEWRIESFEKKTSEIGLADLGGRIEAMLQGKHVGRDIVRLAE